MAGVTLFFGWDHDFDGQGRPGRMSAESARTPIRVSAKSSIGPINSTRRLAIEVMFTL